MGFLVKGKWDFFSKIFSDVSNFLTLCLKFFWASALSTLSDLFLSCQLIFLQNLTILPIVDLKLQLAREVDAAIRTF